MKSVLISIKPQYCELIASGKKTVEVRKTKPKLETPFKVYIYCTKQGKQFFHGGIGEKECLFKNPDTEKIKFDYSFELMCCKNEYTKDNFLSGKVIGEFVCDRIVQFENSLFDEVLPETVARSCVPMYDLLVYLGKQDFGYGWHISNLVIYDKPRELSEFKKPCNHKNDCCTCDRYDYIGHRCYDEITRPPQSWCYVESEGEG